MKAFAVVLAAMVIFSLPAAVQAEAAAQRSRLLPDTIFLKSGLAEQAMAFTLGLGWKKRSWLPALLPAGLSLSLEAEIGHWQTIHLRHAEAEFTQFGVTPMLRLPLATSLSREWFIEGGVGFHFIVPLYHRGDRRFSTSFNFQDLIGLGARFGTDLRHEVVIYVSHFSNGAIKEPNPGENFLQLRYLRHFD